MSFLDRFLKRGSRSASNILLSVFSTLANAETLHEAQRILKRHPELLTNEVDALALQLARTQDNEEDLLMIVDAIALLHRSREIGIDAAIEQAIDMLAVSATCNSILQEYIKTTRLDELKQYLEAHPELLVTGVEAWLDRLIISAQIRSNQDTFRRLKDRQTLLWRCRAIGIEAAFKELREAIDEIKPLMQKIWREYNTIAESDLFELERTINSYPEILGHEFNFWLKYLGALTKTQGDKKALQRFEEYQKLLRRCLEVGTDVVVREKQHIHPVAHSFAGPREVTCPHCEYNFNANIWLIVDVVARPDLLEKICDETLHVITCPTCSRIVGRTEPPLLLYQPGKSPTLFASPASDESQNDLLSSLVDILRGSLGSHWKEEWVANGIPSTPRFLLPVVLADDPEAAWLKLGKKEQQLREKLQEMDPEGFREIQEIAATTLRKTEPVRHAVQQFVQAEDWLTSKQIIESHPEILSDEADYLLDQLAMAAYLQGDPMAAHLLGSRLELLRHCREKGVMQAFSEETGLHFIDVARTDFMHNSPIMHPSPTVQEVLFEMDKEFMAGNVVELFFGNKMDTLEEDIVRFWDSRPDLVQKLREAEQSSFDAALTPELRSLLHELSQPINPLEMSRRVQLCQRALTLLPREKEPQLWAMLQKELGVCLIDNTVGDRAENIEQGIVASGYAMRVFTRKAAPDEWANVMHNLGIAYMERVRGDRTANIEQAVKVFQQVLEVLTRTEHPTGWSRTMTELAIAYGERIQGDRAENIERAIEAYEQALQVRTREATPVQWARTTCNLAAAYLKRIQGDRAENIEQAIKAYEGAVVVFSQEAMPVEWARTMRSLGTAYEGRIGGDRAENIERAIDVCEQALKILTRQAASVEWAGTMNNLAILYKKRLKGDKATNLEDAISAYQLALEVLSSDSLPYGCRQTAANLGILHFERGDWESAYAVYALAIQAAEVIYHDTFVPLNQQAEIEKNAALYDGIIATCVYLRDDQHYAREGLIYLEAARARIFLSQMSQADFPPPSGLPPDLLTREHGLLLQLRRFEQAVAVDSHSNDLPLYRSMGEASFQTTYEQIRDTLAWQKVNQHKILRDELERLWDTLAREYPIAQDYVALRRAQSPTWGDLVHLASRLGSEAAVVEFCTWKDEIVAFVLREGWTGPQIVVLPIPYQRLLHRYFLPYQDEVLNRKNLTQSNRQPTHSWLALGKDLLEPLESALSDAKLVYLIPHGLLHLMPLHALTIHGTPFIARHAVVYAPSAAVLTRTLERTQLDDKNTSPLVLGYTSSSDPLERTLFLNEAQAIATHFACSPVLDAAANVGTLLKRAPSASHIHLSCHGRFNTGDPLASRLDLAEGSFSARDWMGLRLRADLVTLSACETGLSTVGHGDEIVGLMRALLYAGASSALLTLWSVSAATTQEWMLDFYRLIEGNTTDKQSKALAFQQATLASCERYPDPYYWAPFVLVGNWH